MAELIGTNQTALQLSPLQLSTYTNDRITNVELTLRDWSVYDYPDTTTSLHLYFRLTIHQPNGEPRNYAIKRSWQVAPPQDFDCIRLIRTSWRLRRRSLILYPEIEFCTQTSSIASTQEPIKTKKPQPCIEQQDQSSFVLYSRNGPIRV